MQPGQVNQTATPPPALELRGVRKAFRQGGVDLTVLDGVDLLLAPGEIVALVGPSGAGKSTMLHVAGLLERPDGGAVLIEGRDCGGLSDEHRTLLRRRALGFVYQFHHLLPEFSALENVMLPQMIAGVGRAAARRKAEMLLGRVGLAERVTHRPARLSGGEQQRVQIVRASGLAALIATHNLELARRLDRIVALEDGRLEHVA